jgi:hypothetical protein
VPIALVPEPGGAQLVAAFSRKREIPVSPCLPIPHAFLVAVTGSRPQPSLQGRTTCADKVDTRDQAFAVSLRNHQIARHEIFCIAACRIAAPLPLWAVRPHAPRLHAIRSATTHRRRLSIFGNGAEKASLKCKAGKKLDLIFEIRSLVDLRSPRNDQRVRQPQSITEKAGSEVVEAASPGENR